MLCRITGGLLLAAVILLCVPLTVPRLFGCQIYTVVSGSMEPAIPTGSVVYVKTADPDSICKNDVIAYYSGTDNGAIITHRVVQNQVISGVFITKGDANEKEDLLPVAYDRFIGKVVFWAPVAGRILAVMAQPVGKLAIVCLLAAAVLLMYLAEKIQDKNASDNIKNK